MTRINVVDPEELCDQHLLAELRELPRIPNAIIKGRVSFDKPLPESYRMGPGHVRFFYDKIPWLYMRYTALWHEAGRRGFKVSWRFPEMRVYTDPEPWYPNSEDRAVNLARILQTYKRFKPRWTETN